MEKYNLHNSRYTNMSLTSVGNKQHATNKGAFNLQYQLPTELWEKILLALEPTEQDKLRFSCKNFYRALQPYIVFVQTSQGETKKSGRDNRTVKIGHVVSSLNEALAELERFRVEYPLRRFEIRLARGRHIVDGRDIRPVRRGVEFVSCCRAPIAGTDSASPL